MAAQARSQSVPAAAVLAAVPMAMAAPATAAPAALAASPLLQPTLPQWWIHSAKSANPRTTVRARISATPPRTRRPVRAFRPAQPRALIARQTTRATPPCRCASPRSRSYTKRRFPRSARSAPHHLMKVAREPWSALWLWAAHGLAVGGASAREAAGGAGAGPSAAHGVQHRFRERRGPLVRAGQSLAFWLLGRALCGRVRGIQRVFVNACRARHCRQHVFVNARRGQRAVGSVRSRRSLVARFHVGCGRHRGRHRARFGH